MERNTEYDPFAAIYNRYWGRDYRAQAFPVVDASSEMVRFARENVPDVAFTVADAREFSLSGRFDAAYSVFESLNHGRTRA